MNTSLPLNEEFQPNDAYQGPRHYFDRESRASYEASEPCYEIGLWLQAVRSFFHTRNHPFPDSEQSAVLTRNWTNELAIARQALLRISQLALRMVHLEDSPMTAGDDVCEDPTGAEALRDDTRYEGRGEMRQPLINLAESMSDVGAICEALLEAPQVSFNAWATVGKIVWRELDRSETARTIERAAYHNAASKLPTRLFDRSLSPYLTTESNGDLLAIVSDLARMLERLRLVDGCLQRDQPLKQTLPVFCLVYEEARLLLEFIAGHVLLSENLERPVFDALDGMNYAIAMELRKVFARELVGLASLRQSPVIYARVENAHGLLRDCFQQSIVGVAQLLDPTLDATRLFDTFQTRLDQSLILRKDLWTLLQLVRRAEQERERHPISRLLERLNSFREGSLRYLMYKDWEACERFIEEVAAARGAVEVTPVVHRFGAYLETLLGQVNMRSVLLDHAFDYSIAEI